MLVGWLCQFAKPAVPGKALEALRPADRHAAGEALDYLQRSGALVCERSEAAASTHETETMQRVRNHLRALARSFYDTACDILGFGPHADRALLEQTGAGIEHRLKALIAATAGLRSELAVLRRPFVESQLTALGVTVDTEDLKLHIGCGNGFIDGWINIDIHPAPLSMNVLWGLPFRTGHVKYVYVSHLLEHLFFPSDVCQFFKELLRVLAPGGILRLVVPDVAKCIEAYTANDRAFFSSRRETWPWWPKNPTRLEDFLAYAGAGAEPAYLFESHKYGYDFETLSKVLREVGFAEIRQSDYMSSTESELAVDHVSAVASAMYGDRHYSLFVEATRPH